MVTLLHDNGELHVEASDGLDAPAHAVRYRARRRHHRQGRREQQADRRAARQQGAGVSQPRVEAAASSPKEELSFICVPILLNRRAVGALGVDLKFNPDRDYDRSVKFLGIVASSIAQAVKIQRLVEEDKKRLVDENTHLRQELKERYDFSSIIGSSGPVRQMYEQMAQVAATNTTVLIRGESGTGKEMVAHAHSLQLAARQQAVRQGELRGAARQPDRIRAVRLRAGRVHRRGAAEEGPLRAGRGRHALPRRDRRHQPGDAGEAAARAAGARVRAAGQHRDDQGQRPAARGDQQGHRAGASPPARSARTCTTG